MRNCSFQCVYKRLDRKFGPQSWWPAESPFEVMVGAVLTQNTAWSNVEKAIDSLRAAELLDPDAIDEVVTGTLAEL
ncbi:MAG TPA: endonuclease, partial [Gammaproteobacteria bacterium]|nr:endonuclease [Gammaproteobacteria bacterium]